MTRLARSSQVPHGDYALTVICRMADRDKAFSADGRRELRGLAEQIIPRSERSAKLLEENCALGSHRAVKAWKGLRER